MFMSNRTKLLQLIFSPYSKIKLIRAVFIEKIDNQIFLIENNISNKESKYVYIPIFKSIHRVFDSFSKNIENNPRSVNGNFFRKIENCFLHVYVQH